MKQDATASTSNQQQSASAGSLETHLRLKQSQEDFLHWLNSLEEDSNSNVKAYQCIR